MMGKMAQLEYNEFRYAFLPYNGRDEISDVQCYDKHDENIFGISEMCEALEDSGCTEPEIRFRLDQIEKNPERFIKIEIITYDEYHMIFESFLESNWTNEKSLKKMVMDCYDGSTSRWIDNVENNLEIEVGAEKIITSWHQYEEAEIKKLIENFLKVHNVDFEWH